MEEKLIKKTFPSVSVIRCAQEGDYESLRMALESGANVNTLDPLTTDSPLMIACRKGFTQVIHLCLEFGAKNDPHPDYGQTALHAAVSCNQYESAKVLLDVAAESDADLLISNLTDPAGQTPLYLAALKGSESMLQLLLNHGAEMNCVDSYGQTCLHLCASSGNKKCMAFILDHGGDILLESRDTNGNTPLHFAAYSGHLDCVRLLLESAADVNQRNNSGQTPYTIASLRGHHQIGLLLLEYKDHHNSVSQNSSRPQSASTMNSISKPKNTGLLLPPRTPVLNRDESDEDKDDQYYTIPIKDYSQSIPSVYANNNNSPLPIPKFQRSLSDTLTLPRPHTLSSPVQSNGNRNRTFSSGKNSPVVSMLSPTVPYSVRSSREGSFKGIATPVGSKSYETERDFVDSPVANGILHNVPAVMSQYQQYSHSDSPIALPPMTPTQDDMFAGLAIFNPVVTGTGTINGKQIFNSLDSMGDDGLLITNQYVEELEVHYKSNNTEEVDDIPLVLEKKSYFSKSVSSSTKEKLVSKNTLKDNYVDEGLDVVHKNKPLHIEVKRDDMSYVEHKADHDEVIDYDTKDDENEPSEAAVDYLELFIHLDRKWYVYVTEEGDVYYYDESTATSQWEDPREHGIIVYEEANEVDGGSDHSSPQKSIGKSGSTSPCPPKSPSPKSLLKFKDFPIDGEVPRSDIKPIPINWASASSSKDGIASGVRLSIDTDNTEDFDCESSPRSFQEEDDGSRNSLHGIATGENEKSSGMRLYKKYSNHSISDGDDDDDFDEILVRDLTSTRRIVNQTTEATTANISEEKDIPISDSKEERLDDFAVKSSGLSSLVAKEKMTNEFEKITLRNDRQQSDANFSSNEYGVDYESKGNLKLSQEVKIITPQSDSTLAHLQLCSPEKFPDNNIYSLLSPSVVSPLPTTASTTPPSRLGMYEELINSGASLVELGNIFEARGDSLEFSSKVLSLADEKLYNNVINSRQRQETGLEIISYEYLNLSNDRIGYVTTDIDNEKLQNLQNHPILCRYINMAALGLPFQSVVVQMEVDGIARPLIAEIEQLFAINNYDDVDVDTYETDKTMGTPDKGKSTGSNLLLSPISLKQVTRTWAYKSAVVQNDEVDIITDADLEEFDKLVKENVDNKLIDSSNTQPLLVITKELSDKIAHLVSQIDLPTYSVVPKAITSLDTLDDSIDLDFLEELQELLKLYMESNITNEQMKLLSSSKNHSEIFLSGLLLFQPDLSRRLGCFISCLSFDDICISVLYKSKKVIKCCNQILSSSKLVRLLKAISVVGQRIDGTEERTIVTTERITLSSLLRAAKSTGTNGKMNKKLTVLDYVLKCAYEKGEEELLLGLVDQLKVVDDCMNMSSQEIVQDMESLQCTLHFLEQELLYSRRKITLHPYVQNSQSQVIQVLRSRYTVQLENYVKEFRVRMPSLLQAKVLLQKKLVDLADFFAYDSSNSDAFNHNSCTVTEKIDTIQIFQSLQELRNEINKSKEKVEWQVYHEKSKTIGR